MPAAPQFVHPDFISRQRHTFTGSVDIYGVSHGRPTGVLGTPTKTRTLKYEGLAALVAPIIREAPTSIIEEQRPLHTRHIERMQAVIPYYLADIRDTDELEYKGKVWDIRFIESDSQNQQTRLVIERWNATGTNMDSRT